MSIRSRERGGHKKTHGFYIVHPAVRSAKAKQYVASIINNKDAWTFDFAPNPGLQFPSIKMLQASGN